MSTLPNRTRTAQTSFRLTTEEKKRWDDACAVSGLCQGQLLLRLLDSRLILVPQLRPTLRELHQQCVNINQALKNLHQMLPEAQKELRGAVWDCHRCYEILLTYLNEIQKNTEDT